MFWYKKATVYSWLDEHQIMFWNIIYFNNFESEWHVLKYFYLYLRLLEGKFLLIINNYRIVRTGPNKLIILILKKNPGLSLYLLINYKYLNHIMK